MEKTPSIPNPETKMAAQSNPSLLHAYVAIATVVLIIIVSSGFASAQDPGDAITISGKVVNGTEGSSPPEEVTVFALVIDGNAEAIVERVETLTDADGSFSLNTPIADDEQFYRVVVDDGVYTPYIDILPEDAQQDVVLTVFDRTDSLDDISVTTYSMVIPVIDEANGVIGVLSAVNLVNSGDEVYVADLTDPALTGLKLLRFNLPVGYQELTVESDLPSGNVLEINTGFAISNPVPPGEYSMVISYSAPFQDGEFEYPLRLPFGADSISILLPEESGQVSGSGLTDSENITIGDVRYTKYDGADYERGAEVGVLISGLPKPGISDQFLDFLDSTQFQVAIVASVAFVLIAVMIYVALIVRRKNTGESEPGFPTRNDQSAARSDIIRSIADLDEMRELGKIDEDEYLVQRQRLVQQAINADDGRDST